MLSAMSPFLGRARSGARFAAVLALASTTSVTLVSGTTLPASASPASVPGPVSITSIGTFSGTVPDGVCAVQAQALGGAGGSSIVSANSNGGGARVNATYRVLPGQAYSGSVGGGGAQGVNGGPGGVGGANGGGPGGASSNIHPGSGGGGWTELNLGGTLALVAGGGGGRGSGHATNGGFGGNAGLPTGAGVTVGSTGQTGFDNPASTVGGGQGGQSAGPGAGGTHSRQSSLNGVGGSGRNGGAGGLDPNADAGGGGGGGYFGGGGGSATIDFDTTAPFTGGVNGGGGGGGASYVAPTSPNGVGTAVSAVSSSVGPKLAGVGNGAIGAVQLTWVSCGYDLQVAKSVSPTPVQSGGVVTWSVTVTNLGPEPMSRGDTVTLTDSLPGAGAKTITSITTTGGSNATMTSPAVTCSAAVGAAMPATLTCSRPYAALPGVGGSPSGGVRGLDVNESLTVTYTQTLTGSVGTTFVNTATVDDRVGGSNNSASATATIGATPPTVKIRKTSVNGTGTFNFSSSIFPSSPVPITTATAGTPATPAGDPAYAAVANQQVTITETVPANWTLSSVTCVNTASNAVVSTTFTPAGQLTIPASALTAGTNLACTFTDTRNSRTLTVTKATVPTADTGQFRMDANGTLGTAGGNGAQSSASVLAGGTATFGETAAAGTSLADYSTAYTCVRADTGAQIASGSTTTGSLTMPDANVNCTITNTRKQASLRIAKTWSGAVVNDTATLSATGPQSVPNFASTANTPSETDTSPASTVNTGEAYNLSETLGSGNTGSYVASAWSCSGGSLSGSTLTIPASAAGTTITCTITNAKQSLGLVKTASPATYSAAGQSVSYSYVLTNTGQVTLSAPFTVADDKIVTPNAVSCPATPTTLGPGQQLTCTATYTTTQVDVNAGSVTNTATATGKNPAGGNVNSATATATVNSAAVASLGLVKTASPATYSAAGQSVSYSYVLTNTGQVTLSAPFTVADDKIVTPNAVSCPATPTTLGPGQQLTCTATYTTTQVDVNAGSVTNTATATGKNPAGGNVNSATATATVNSAAVASLGLVKTASPATYSAAGQSVSYSYVLTNTGQVTLSAPFTVADDKIVSPNAVSCPATPTTLGPGQQLTCTATYTTTQVDVNAGSVTNTATATGKNPAGGNVNSATATATVNSAAVASLGLVKTASPATYSAAGQSVSYSYVLTNTGQVTLSAPFTVADDKIVTPNAVSCPATPTTLGPGQQLTCTATYTTTQVDVNAGSVTNTATATGKNPAGGNVNSATATATVNSAAVASLGLVKTASPATYSAAGQSVSYSYVLTNTGQVTLSAPFTVADDKIVSPNAVSCPATPTTLGPGQQLTCTATYTTTQVDVNAGSVTNTATATGKNPAGGNVNSATATATVNSAAVASLGLVKTASPATYSAAGQSVSYSYVLTNTGQVTLSAPFTVADDKIVTPNAVSCPATPTTLGPGQQLTCTATYTTTQVDVNAGSVTNTATATGKNPAGGNVNSATATATVNSAAVASLGLVKTASPATYSAAGQSVSYSYVLTNTGQVTLSAPFTVADDKIVTPNAVSCPATPTTLGPGQQLTCTATYTTTQVDVNAGSVTNTATATGKNPAGGNVNSATATATVNSAAVASLGLVKTASPATYSAAGQSVSYSYVLTNTGQVTLSAPFTVADDKIVTPNAVSCPATPTTLGPGQQLTCTATYTTTQVDVNAGSVTNTATATGKNPAGGNVNSATATATVNSAAVASLGLVKTASPATYSAAGQSVSYSYVLTNTGQVTLSAPFTVADDKIVSPNAVSCPATPTTLGPGQQLTCTATYTTTQVDVNAGSVTNTATATGKNPAGGNVNSATATATVNSAAVASLGLVKTASPATYSAAGQSVSYSYVLTNTGQVTLSAPFTVADDKIVTPNAVSCPATPTTLGPGQQLTCTATYTTTQVDVNAGSVTNTATATGKNPAGGNVNSATATATVNSAAVASLGLVKTASPATYSAAGQSVSYSYVLTNTGQVTLSAPFTVADDKIVSPNAVSCPATPTTLGPGQQLTCTATYTTTQVDVNAGSVTNTATATGKNPAGGNVNSATATATVNSAAVASLGLVKTASPATYSAAGQSVSYSYVLTNTGQVTLSAPFTVADDKIVTPNAVSCPATPTSLAPATATTAAGSITCTATYTTTQADVNAGSVTNTATATGNDPSDTAVESNETTATINSGAVSALTLVKTADPATYSAAGQSVSYSYVVTNTGQVTLSAPFTVADDKIVTPNAVSCPATPTTLGPGQRRLTCTATYTTTQADVNAGSVTNTATATGNDPSDTAVESNETTATITADQAPALSLVKTADPTTYSAAGQSVTYSYVVTNTGNVTMSAPFTVADDKIVSPNAVSCPATPTSLAPATATTAAGSITCTATYTTTQADVNAGSVTNTATATGNDPSDTAVESNETTATITADQAPALSLVKTADPTTYSAAGQSVTYSYVVTNTGNVTMSAPFTVADDKIVSPNAVSCPATPTSLAPATATTAAGSITCTATYTTTQADVNAGSVTNTATATGNDPSDTAVESNETTATITADQAPALSLVKTADPTTYSAAGQSVTYSYVVTNTGNVTMSAPFTVADDKIVSPNAVSCPATPTSLAPATATTAAGSITCTATYTTTQADVNAGSVTNTATATGNDPSDTAVESNETTATITADQAPALSLVKTADPTTYSAAGQSVTYSYVVTNTGNVTMSAPFTVADDKIVSPNAVSCPATPTSLAPATATTAAGSITCTATYTTTQADVNAGSVTNTATATGNDPSDTAVESNETTATITADQAPALSLVKTADPTTYSAAGQSVTYSYVVTNTGNVTMSAPFTVADDKIVSPNAVSCPATPTSLAPATATTAAGSITCTATYTTTQADVNAGSVTNTATATGNDPSDTAVESNETTATITADQAPALSLVKTADPTTYSAAGQSVTYSYVVTNTGNVTMSAPFTVADDKIVSPNAVSCPATPTSLAPATATTAAGSITCTATYTTTQADVNAGSVTNTATATGNDPSDTAVESNETTATITADQAPALSLVKTADPTTYSAAGQSVTYSYVVTNTGNVTMSAPFTVADDKIVSPNAVSCPATPTSLAPATATTAAGSITCTATYTTTQADVNAGSVTNTATATGNDPSDTAVESNETTATITADQAPALSLVKTADPTTYSAAGQSVTYSYVVTNTGNVTMSAPFTVADDKIVSPNAVSCPATPTSLAPATATTAAGSITCTATYTTTQADVNAGSVTNTATATGNDPSDTAVESNETTATITADQAPALSLVKTADPTTYSAAGQSVTYSYVVTNTGNVTMSAPFTVADDKIVSPNAVSCPATPTSLAPATATTAAGSITCTATYTTTQADVNAGSVTNTATATGNDPSDTAVESNETTATITADQAPALSLVKTADPTTYSAAGQSVTYSYVVTNTGNVTMSAPFTVADDKIVSPNAVSCPATPTSLAPATATTAAGSITCTATYTTTQADVNAGSVTNTATATGNDPSDTAVESNETTATIITDQAPAVTLDKVVVDISGFAAGDTITYEFILTNTGNVTLSPITVTDDKVGAVTCPVTSLAPTESTTCTAAPYVLTQADVNAGSVTNTASASGTPPATPGNPNPTPVEDTDTVVTPIDELPGIDLVKKADQQGPVKAGDKVTYAFVVTNIGNVTLADVRVDDPMLGTVSCPRSTLAPGESMTCTAPPYTVTAADVVRGSIVNQATASASAGVGVEVSSDDELVIKTEASPTLPDTGSPVRMPMVLFAVGMLTGGLGLLVAGRRKSDNEAG